MIDFVRRRINVDALSINFIRRKHITDMLYNIVTTLDRQVTLRSADNNDLFIFRSRLHLGKRAFRNAAPRALNSLPSNFRSAATVSQDIQEATKDFAIFQT